MSNDDKCPCVDGLPDPCTLCGAPADGVCEIDTLVGWKHRAQRAEAEARQLRALTEGDPYSIYYEAAEMRSELMHLRRWKLEATEVIESWELVYEALGDVGGLAMTASPTPTPDHCPTCDSSEDPERTMGGHWTCYDPWHDNGQP